MGECRDGAGLSSPMNKEHFSLLVIGHVGSFISRVLNHKDKVGNHFNFHSESAELPAWLQRAKKDSWLCMKKVYFTNLIP